MKFATIEIICKFEIICEFGIICKFEIICKFVQQSIYINCVHEKQKLKIVKFATLKDHTNCVHEKLKLKNCVICANQKSNIISKFFQIK